MREVCILWITTLDYEEAISIAPDFVWDGTRDHHT
jgi:hypothetical protein